MRLHIVLAALLCACTGCATAGTPMPRSELDGVVQAWRAAGLPYGDTCREQRSDVRVEVASGSRFLELCRRELQPGHMESCSIGTLIVVGPEFDLPGYRAHEALHWLQNCGMRVNDVGHENPIIWGVPLGAPGSLLHALGG